MKNHAEGCGVPHVYVCAKCGSIVHPHEFHRDPQIYDRMLNDSVCFECAYWMNIIDHRMNYDYIIEHQYYAVLPIIKPKKKIAHILTHEGHIIHSSELFRYGEIPERFWDDLPNNANFITHQKAKSISVNSEFHCDRIGCWDRKYCFWFHGQMDWNEIPKNHEVGSENCPMFINKLNPKQ